MARSQPCSRKPVSTNRSSVPVPEAHELEGHQQRAVLRRVGGAGLVRPAEGEGPGGSTSRTVSATRAPSSSGSPNVISPLDAHRDVVGRGVGPPLGRRARVG